MATRFSLRDLALQPGSAAYEQLPVTLRPYRQGGFDYRATGDGEVVTELDVNAMSDGLALRLRFGVELEGPCARCLEDASLTLRIDSHEVHDPKKNDPELVSEFVEQSGEQLNLSAWAQDAIGLEFPWRVLCREDCKGLCAQCGANLNETSCDCEVVSGDPRWEKLRDLQLGDG